MPTVVEGKLEQLAELRPAKEKLEARLAEAEAAACGEKKFAERHCDESDLPYLQKVASHWQSGSAAGLLFLTAKKGQEAAFLIATRGDLNLDIKALGQEVAAEARRQRRRRRPPLPRQSLEDLEETSGSTLRCSKYRPHTSKNCPVVKIRLEALHAQLVQD